MHIQILKKTKTTKTHRFLQVGYCFCTNQCKKSSRNPKVQKQALMIYLFVKFYMFPVCDSFYVFPLRWLAEDESDGHTTVQLYPQLLDF